MGNKCFAPEYVMISDLDYGSLTCFNKDPQGQEGQNRHETLGPAFVSDRQKEIKKEKKKVQKLSNHTPQLGNKPTHSRLHRLHLQSHRR